MTNNNILVLSDNKTTIKNVFKLLKNDFHVYVSTIENFEIDNSSKSDIKYSVIIIGLTVSNPKTIQFYYDMQKSSYYSTTPFVVIMDEFGNGIGNEIVKAGAVYCLLAPNYLDTLLYKVKNLIAIRESASIHNIEQKDFLTGLYNKETFYQKAQHLIKISSKYKYDIVAVNIAKFKLINDIYGVSYGDDLLKAIAKKLNEIITNNTGFCGRISADNFICITRRHYDYEKLFIKELQDAIKQFDEDLNLHLVFGIYKVGNKDTQINLMCDRAKLACDKIKDCYDVNINFYDDKIRNQLLNEQDITKSMEQALLFNQFIVCYQPKYQLSDEKIVGAEALVRWMHPIRGMIPPNEFIPIFEKNGFITKLDLYVLEKTCIFIRTLINNRIKTVPISVNYSRVDFFSPNIVGKSIAILKKYGLEPYNIHIEITETVYSENSDDVKKIVKQFKEAGFIIEMDDFGSGYSSLNMLNELPLNVLKLDMKFFQSVNALRKDKNIITFIIALAKWLDFSIVAEGVETLEQVNFLKTINCDFVQGYYYSKPLFIRDFVSKLQGETISEDTKNNSINVSLVSLDCIWNPVSTFNEFFNSNLSCSAIISYNEKGEIDIIRANKRFSESFNFVTSLLYKNVLHSTCDFFGSSYDEFANELKKSSLTNKSFSMPIVVHDYQLQNSWNVIIDVKPIILNEQNRIFLCVFNNITKNLDTNEKENLLSYAYIDYLTMIYNRRGFIYYFENEKNKDNHNLNALYLIDIDNFKSINDNYGHNAGDKALIEVANSLTTTMRNTDVIGRYGGDEIVVLVKDIKSEKSATIIGEKICTNIAKLPINITCSIGVQIYYNSKDTDFMTVLSCADSALYKAKNTGKNKCVLYKE